MTEDEAKTKWCPFARVAGQMGGEAQGTSFNRWTTGAAGGASDPAACIGSACMAWRVRHQWLDNALQEPGWVTYPPYAFEPGPGQERDDGYCGLAGAPQ